MIYPTDTVLGFVSQYELENHISKGYRVQLEVAARSFERFAERPLRWREVTDDLVNEWLKAEQERASPLTVHGKRRAVLTLWRAAFDSGLVEHLPRRIRQIKCPELKPEAFLLEELKAMLIAADAMKGVYRKIGIEKSLWWRSFLMAKWDVALRLSDMLSLEREWIWPSGTLSLIQQKTGHSHRVKLRPKTLEAIDACMACNPNRRLIWPLWCQRNRWYGHFRRLRNAAGLSKGTSKWIRRSSASYVEKLQPGMGSRHLGHRSPELFQKHYKDPRICGDDPTLPPEL